MGEERQPLDRNVPAKVFRDDSSRACLEARSLMRHVTVFFVASILSGVSWEGSFAKSKESLP